MAVTFKRKGKKPFAAPWHLLKEDWINQNLEPGRTEDYQLKELAIKWGTKLGSLRRISALEKWADQLHDIRQKQAETAVARVQAIESFNEIETRLRHATVSREAMELGLSRIRSLNKDQITNKEAIELVKLGLDGERKALGLPETFSFIPTGMQGDGSYKPVSEAIQDQVKLKMLGAKLLKFAERVSE